MVRNENQMGLSTTSNYADQINPVNSIYVQSPHGQAREPELRQAPEEGIHDQYGQMNDQPVQRIQQPVKPKPIERVQQQVQRVQVQQPVQAQPVQQQRNPRDTHQSEANKWEESQYSASSYSNSAGTVDQRSPQVIKNNIPGGPRKMRTNRTSHTRSKPKP